jgi:hypothetical protein
MLGRVDLLWLKQFQINNTISKLIYPLGVINQNTLLIIFLMAIYIQLVKKCQSELVEDIKKDTFRQAQCDNLV